MIEIITKAKILGGTFTICCYIFGAIVKYVFEPIQNFHKQWLASKEVK